MTAGVGNHHYERTLAAEAARPRQRMVKVGKELAGLAADLPLDARSSVFVRARPGLELGLPCAPSQQLAHARVTCALALRMPLRLCARTGHALHLSSRHPDSP